MGHLPNQTQTQLNEPAALHQQDITI